jgi:hypothetical protein
MHKIQFVSQIFLWVLRALLILLLLSLLLFWVDAPNGLIKSTLGEGWASLLAINYMAKTPPILHTLSATTKLLGFLVSLIPVSINMLTVYFLLKLFKNYAALNIFSLENARFIKRTGLVIFIGQMLLKPIHDLLLSALVTWNNPPGHRVMTLSFGTTNLEYLACALVIILVSWIMTAAYEEQETSKLIV